MIKDLKEYVQYSINKETLFYSRSNESSRISNPFKIPNFDIKKWFVHSDEHWTNLMFKEKNLPDQGWKIHITADVMEAQDLLYDVANYLIKNEISFKYVPNILSLQNKNSKYSNRSSSGKFVTVYPESEKLFIKLLNDLKEITKYYKLGPYILNDQQWQESNVFFRYGGFKRISTDISGEKVLAIRRPDGTLIKDERTPYYHLPDFVNEPDFIKENNVFPSQNIFSKLKDLKIIEAIHHSNAGGVYLVESGGKQFILKEGRHNAGIDSNGNDGFQRNKNEYHSLKRLADVEGVINVHEYFTSWRHNYFIEDYNKGVILQKFIAQEFPFTSSDDRKTVYVEKCISIINQLMKIIEEIHENDIAMGDLSQNNIMLSENDLKVTLIDFEAATSPEATYSPVIATPGLISSEARSYKEADWFSFYRIARTLFLPVNSVYDIAPNIIKVHDKKIEEKFGEKASSFLREIEKKVSKITNLRPQSQFSDQKLGTPTKELSLKNIDYVINGLQEGIMNNLEANTFSLIKGNIEQYYDSINKFNIGHGAFGVILALMRSCDESDISVKESISEWLELVIPYIEKESENIKGEIGLFTGFPGIITVLYELGYKESAELILNNLLKNFLKEKINTTDDISIFSGLSGLGLFYLSFYKISEESNLLESIDLIYNRIINLYENSIDGLENSADFGLLTGWSGASLFLFKTSLILDRPEGKNIAFEIVDKSLRFATDTNNDNEELFIIDNSNDSNSLIPYIEDGSSGIALVMLEFKREDKDYLNKSRKETLDKFIKSNNLFCSVDGGLMSGYAGFIPLANATSQLNDKAEMLENLLNNLNNYLVSNDNDEILFPGKFGLKCSMDISTGSAGVLLILSDLKKKNWGSWLPLPKSGVKLFEL